MLDKIKGSLIGGAVGDALGYTVEFMQDSQIFRRFGERGITEYELKDGLARISDDTQMTLFTLEGLLRARNKHKSPGVSNYVGEIYLGYLDWYKTQYNSYDASVKSTRSKLLNIPEMYTPRAPGNTCLSALSTGRCGTIERKINNSKGCGGVMRIAPIPLMLTGKLDIDTVDMISAEAAASTHGHMLGYVPAAFISHIISEIILGKDLPFAVQSARENMYKLFEKCEFTDYFDKKIELAISLAKDSDIDSLDAIREIGEGWVAEETAAISVYCALRYSDSFEDAVVASVNHSGDSDSTGDVTGNIMGAYLGYSSIPNKYLQNLEHRELIEEMANEI